MACVYKINDKQFKSKDNLLKYLNTIMPNATSDDLFDYEEAKANTLVNGAEDVYLNNPKLAEIGSVNQYSNYLNTIFPDSIIPVLHKGYRGKTNLVHNVVGRSFFTNQFKIADKWYKNEKGIKSFKFNSIDTINFSADQSLHPLKVRKAETNFTNDSDEDVVILYTEDIGGKQLQYIIKDEVERYELGTEEDLNNFKKFIENQEFNLDEFIKFKNGQSSTANVSYSITEEGGIYKSKFLSAVEEEEALNILTGRLKENTNIEGKQNSGAFTTLISDLQDETEALMEEVGETAEVKARLNIIEALTNETILKSKLIANLNRDNYLFTENEELTSKVSDANERWDDTHVFVKNPSTTINSLILSDIYKLKKNNSKFTGLPLYFDSSDVDLLIRNLYDSSDTIAMLRNLKILAGVNTNFKKVLDFVMDKENPGRLDQWFSNFSKSNVDTIYVEKLETDTGNQFSIKSENLDVDLGFNYAAKLTNSIIELNQSLQDNKSDKLSLFYTAAKKIFNISKEDFNKSSASDELDFIKLATAINKDKNESTHSDFRNKMVLFFQLMGVDFELNDMNILGTYLDVTQLKNSIDVSNNAGKIHDRDLRGVIEIITNIANYLDGQQKNPSITNYVKTIANEALKYSSNANIMFLTITGNMQYSINNHTFLSEWFNNKEGLLNNSNSILKQQLEKLANQVDMNGNRIYEDHYLFADSSPIGYFHKEGLGIEYDALKNFNLYRIAGVIDARARYNAKEYKNTVETDDNISKLIYFLGDTTEHKNLIDKNSLYYQPLVISSDRSHQYMMTVKKFPLGTSILELIHAGNVTAVANSEDFAIKALKGNLRTDLAIMKNEYYRLFGNESKPSNKLANNYAESNTTLLNTHYKLKNGKKVFIEKGRLTGNAFKHNSIYIELDGKKMYLGEFLKTKGLENLVEDNNVTLNVFNLITLENKDALNNALDEFIAHFVINESTKANELYNTYYEQFKDKYSKEEYRDKVTQMAINYAIHYKGQEVLFTGHSSNYNGAIDFNKRMLQLLSSGRRSTKTVNLNRDDTDYYVDDNFNSLNIDDVISNVIFEEPLIDNVIRYFNLKVNKKKVKDTIYGGVKNDLTKDEQFLGKYLSNFLNIEATDGTSIIDLDEFEKRTKKFGTYELYKESINYYKDLELGTLDEGLPSHIKPLNSLKEFYYGLHEEFDSEGNLTLRYPKQIKNSTFVIIPAIVKGTSLEKVYAFMKKHDIQQLNFNSAVKEGNIGSFDLFNNLDGALKRSKGNKFIPIGQDKYSNLIVQQELPVSSEDHQNKLGIQISKIILSNVNPEASYKFNGQTINGKDITSQLLDLYSKQVAHSGKKLMLELGMTHLGDNINVEKFKKILREELDARGSNNVLYSSIELKYMESILEHEKRAEFKYPLAIGANSSKLKELILSIFTNRVVNQKFIGQHSIQVTQSILKKNEIDIETNLPDSLKFIGLKEDGLKAIQLPNGTIQLEVYIRRPKGINDPKELEAIGADKLVGYRIPTEDKRSMFIAKVVGFLPDSYSGSIVLPDSIVAQTGSDFDIDTMYLMQYSLYRSNEELNIDRSIEDISDKYNLNTQYIKYISDLLPRDLVYQTKDDEDLYTDAKSFFVEFYNKMKNDIEVRDYKYRTLKAEYYERVKEPHFNIKEIFVELHEDLESKDSQMKETSSVILDELNKNLRLYNEALKNKDIFTFEKYIGMIEFADEQIQLQKQNFNNIDANLRDYYIDIFEDLKHQYQTILDYTMLRNSFSEELGLKYANKESRVRIAEEFAEVLKLPNLEDFQLRSLEDRATTIQNNNAILDRYLAILSHPDQAVEMNSGSDFEEIQESKRMVEALEQGKEQRLKKGENAIIMSSFTLTDNINFRTINLQAKMLKANSVSRDNVLNILQRLNGSIDPSSGYSEVVYLDTEANRKQFKGKDYVTLYSYDKLAKDFTLDVKKEEAEKAGNLTLNYFTFGKNEKGGFKNKDGYNITAYSSKTTANILDAVKFPMPKGFDTFGFQIVKTMVDMGMNYNYAVLFMNSPAVKMLTHINLNESNSVFSKSYVDYFEKTKNHYFYQLYNLLTDVEKKQLNIEDRYIDHENQLLSISTKKERAKQLSILFNKTKVNFGNAIFSTKDLAEGILNDRTITDEDVSIEDKRKHYIGQLEILESFKSINAITKSITNKIKLLRMDKLGAGPSSVVTSEIQELLTQDVINYYTSSDLAPAASREKEILAQPLKIHTLVEDRNGNTNKLPISLAVYPEAFDNIKTKYKFANGKRSLFNNLRDRIEFNNMNENNSKVEFDYDLLNNLKSAYPHFEAYYNNANRFSQLVLEQVFEDETEDNSIFFNTLNPKFNSKLDKRLKAWRSNLAIFHSLTMDKFRPNQTNELNSEVSRVLSMYYKENPALLNMTNLKFELDSDFDASVNPKKEILKKFEKYSTLHKLKFLRTSDRYQEIKKELNFDLLGNIEESQTNNEIYTEDYIKFKSLIPSDRINAAHESLVRLWTENAYFKSLIEDLIYYTLLTEGLNFSKSSLAKIFEPSVLFNKVGTKNDLDNISGLNLAENFKKHMGIGSESGYSLTDQDRLVALAATRYANTYAVPTLNTNNRVLKHPNIPGVLNPIFVSVNNLDYVRAIKDSEVVQIYDNSSNLINLSAYKSNNNNADKRANNYIATNFENWSIENSINVFVTPEDLLMNPGDIVTLDLSHIKGNDYIQKYAKIQILPSEHMHDKDGQYHITPQEIYEMYATKNIEDLKPKLRERNIVEEWLSTPPKEAITLTDSEIAARRLNFTPFVANLMSNPTNVNKPMRKVVFKTLSVGDKLAKRDNNTRPYAVKDFSITVGVNRTEDFKVLIPMAKLLSGETNELSIIPSNNVTLEGKPLTVENYQELLNTNAAEIRKQILKERESESNTRVLKSITEEANTANINLHRFVGYGAQYIYDVARKDNTKDFEERRFEGVAASISNVDSYSQTYSLADMVTMLDGMLFAQDNDIDFINKTLPLIRENIEKLENAPNHELKLTTGSLLQQVEDALDFVQYPAKLELLPSSNNNVVNSRITRLKDSMIDTAKARVEYYQLVRRFIETSLRDHTTNPEILMGVRTFLDEVDDENFMQRWLNPAGHSNNPIMANAIKQVFTLIEHGRQTANAENFKLESLIRDYNQKKHGNKNLDLTEEEWDLMFESIDGEVSDTFLMKSSTLQFFKKYKELKKTILGATKDEKSKNLAKALIEYQTVREGLWKTLRDAEKERLEEKRKAEPDVYTASKIAQLMEFWHKGNSRFNDHNGEYEPNYKYREPDPDKFDKPKNKNGQTFDDMIADTSKGSLGAVFKYVTEKYVELGKIHSQNNRITRGGSPIVADDGRMSFMEAMNDRSKFFDYLKNKSGYYTKSNKKKTTDLAGRDRYSLEFKYIDILKDHSSIVDVVKKLKESSEDYEARFVDAVYKFTVEKDKEYLADDTNFETSKVFGFNRKGVTPLTYNNALAINKMIQKAEYVKIFKSSDGKTINALKTITSINRQFNSTFTFGQLHIIHAVNRVIKERNRAFTEEHKAKNRKAIFKLFTLNARMYEQKKNVEASLLTYNHYMKSDQYGVRKVDSLGKVRVKVNTLGENKKISKGGVLDKLVQYETLRGNSRTNDHFDDWIKMIFYDQFEEDEGSFTKFSRVLQNYTSAKGMWFNLSGAINNVAYGKLQMLQEIHAKEFTDPTLSTAALMADSEKTYWSAISSYFADKGEYASTKQSALIKKFDIVQLQDEKALAYGYQKNTVDGTNRANYSSFYLLHHSGEHYMQNQMLFMMLKSHRIINGKIQSFNDYLGELRLKVLIDMGLEQEVKDFTDEKLAENHKISHSKALKLYLLEKLPKSKFKEFTTAYEKLEKTAQKEFNSYKSLYDSYTFNNDLGQVEPLDELDKFEFEKFKGRVIAVNQDVHGIYNQFDAGALNQLWWGRLMYQFKKWMKPAYDKRFGSKWNKEFWNEARSSKDIANYGVFLQFIIDWVKYGNKMNHLLKTLDRQDQAAVKTTMMEIMGAMGIGLIYFIALSLDLDDEDDSRLASLLMYQIDRTWTEVSQFTPIGIYNEYTKLQKQPMASQNSLQSFGRMGLHMIQGLTGGGWVYKGGSYNGEFKLATDLLRNTPIVNTVDKFANNRFGSYYKMRDLNMLEGLDEMFEKMTED
jgi:predicted RNase H-related nuclease YkuK (DUF458 family)